MRVQRIMTGLEPAQATAYGRVTAYRLPGSPGLPTMIPPSGYTNSPSHHPLAEDNGIEPSTALHGWYHLSKMVEHQAHYLPRIGYYFGSPLATTPTPRSRFCLERPFSTHSRFSLRHHPLLSYGLDGDHTSWSDVIQLVS